MRHRLRRLQAAASGGNATRVHVAALLAGAALIASGQATVAEAGAYVAPFLLISEQLAAQNGTCQLQCDSGTSLAPPPDSGPMDVLVGSGSRGTTIARAVEPDIQS